MRATHALLLLLNTGVVGQVVEGLDALEAEQQGSVMREVGDLGAGRGCGRQRGKCARTCR